ncbi:MAG: flavin reductase family protein [Clostridiales Family XIII bacterium]|jgi:flavin reductase (DIM6/NTAB) family NADH-FMN oxidoreductase RutF|nr:flavin reductase family protein [Clostridiales Family XIII bacterium]
MEINALSTKLTYGLHVVSVHDAANARPAGFIIDAVCQLSMDEPPTVVFSVMNKNYSKGCIKAEGVFNLSILPESVDPFVIANFGFQTSKDTAKWDNVPYTLRAGLPALDQAISWAQFKVTDIREMGTHTAFFSVPTNAEYLNGDLTPLRYADYFTKLKEPAFAAFKAFQNRTPGKGQA